MAKIGRFNNMIIIKEREAGVYLDGGNLGEILLPKRFVPENFEINETISAFIYLDSEDRLIATTKEPFAQAGEFALLKVVSSNNIGAFLKWGLSKDLFVPHREQATAMEVNKSYVVYIYVDQETQRLVGSARINRHIEKIKQESELEPFKEGDPVDIMISAKTELGFKAIIENREQGMIFANEVFRHLQRGEKLTAYIKKIREDGKIDLVLQKPTYQVLDEISQQIMDKLISKHGFLNLTDKSSPELIASTFGISKKSFKKGLGNLYKQRLIEIKDDGIYQIEVNQQNSEE